MLAEQLRQQKQAFMEQTEVARSFRDASEFLVTQSSPAQAELAALKAEHARQQVALDDAERRADAAGAGIGLSFSAARPESVFVDQSGWPLATPSHVGRAAGQRLARAF